ncbi:hypothetical protein [Arthrobacter roseus]|uniref:hypothetical protein n=1 Tax=Arthrobacter roseus TaxID=136274 RepID=UPI0019668418|nr:hypothetical protein [Arthrobacter roseus]MBM7849618.1 hypothetical protein [Arthrobacter roseus]
MGSERFRPNDCAISDALPDWNEAGRFLSEEQECGTFINVFLDGYPAERRMVVTGDYVPVNGVESAQNPVHRQRSWLVMQLGDGPMLGDAARAHQFTGVAGPCRDAEVQEIR